MFLYRDVAETVQSFLRVMSAFQKLSSLFTNQQEIMKYWLTDLPLPHPDNNNNYRWVRDQQMLVRLGK